MIRRSLHVGDVHANTNFLADAFRAAAKHGVERVIQQGDLGVGFRDFHNGKDGTLRVVAELVQMSGIPFDFLDGNHENFDHLRSLTDDDDLVGPDPVHVADGVRWLRRGAKVDLLGLPAFVVGSSYSVDQNRRIEGVSWWTDEELSIADAERVIDLAKQDRREGHRVLLTHDVPERVLTYMLNDAGFTRDEAEDWRNRFPGAHWTRSVLDQVHAAWKPDLLIHGHYHHSWDRALGPAVIGLGHEDSTDGLAILQVVDGDAVSWEHPLTAV